MTDIIFNRKVSFVPSEQLVGPICYGWSISPFGQCFILLQSDTVVGIAFKNDQSENKIETSIKSHWSDSATKFEPFNTNKKAINIFFENGPIRISFCGTHFQTKIWKTLLEIPVGETTTYSCIAKKTDNLKAVRAVATAIGQNPIAWLIPCHRIIRKSGALGGYRWGLEIKKLMLSKETKT